MAVPYRLFRGSDMPQEVQIENIRKELAGRVDSNNLATSAVVPAMTVATNGGAVVTMGANISWSFASMSFASSTATQITTFLHSLGRTPVGWLNILANPVDPPIAAVSTGQWNNTQVIFAVVPATTTFSYRLLFL